MKKVMKMMKKPRSDVDQYKFTIDRLIATYLYEPTLKDVFVEGSSDEAIVRGFSAAYSLDRIKVFQINDVCIPSGLVGPSFGSGNRGRVVALAHSISAEIPSSLQNKNMICIADTDMDRDIPITHNCDRLLFTDYTCLEATLFSIDFLKWIFQTYFFKKYNEDCLSDIVSICIIFYYARVFKMNNCKNLSWVDQTGNISLKDGRIVLDREGFLQKLLGNQGQKSIIGSAKEYIDKMTLSLPSEIRSKIHKDDFFSLTCWYAKNLGAPQEICKPDVFSRVVLSHMRPDTIKDENLFREIHDWHNISQ